MKSVGLVKYLNALPLTDALSKNKIQHSFNLKEEVPSLLADELKDDLLDIAIIPAIEYARLHQPMSVIPGICIGSKGPVASVLLFFNKDLKNIRKVALDVSSRTSVGLAKILLKEKYGLTPDYIPMKPDLQQMLSVADAALVIGDNALEWSVDNRNYFDMADEWFDWTGLPFVFAFWAGKENVFSQNELLKFRESKHIGISNTQQIAEEYAKTHSQNTTFYQRYLDVNIQYEMTDDYLEGLNAYLEMAFYHSLIDSIPQINFFDIDEKSLMPSDHSSNGGN